MSTIRYLQHDGRPHYWVGLNYWARHAGPLMWRHWRPDLVRAELEQMRSLGVNVCRSFLYMPDFWPAPDRVDPQLLERLAEFLDLCAEAGLQTVPSFFVGHMSGENWDIPWRNGRNFYSDPWMLEREEYYVQTVVRRVHRSPALAGWILSNEIPHYGGETDAASGLAWARRMVAAVRAVDPLHPVSLGDGGWHVLGGNPGLPHEPLAKIVDFFGPHLYASENDPLRHSYLAAYATAASDYGLPVIMEEFGCSSAHCSPEHQADYFRTTYHSSLAAGAAGAIGWCFSDFDLPGQRPYAHHAFELLFGVTTAGGSLKPAAREVARFAQLVDGIDLASYRLPEPRAFLVEPSSVHQSYPFYLWLSPSSIVKVQQEAFTLSRQARLDVGFWREPGIVCNSPDGVEGACATPLPAGARLLLAPHMSHLTAPTWEALADFAARGGTVYLSYFHGASLHNFEALTGCRHQLRYGLADIPVSPVEITFRRPLISLPMHTRLRYTVPPDQTRAACCPIEAVEAEVLATDAEDRPAIVLHRLGAGQVVFSAYPLEYYLLQARNAHDEDNTWLLYRALRDLAGLAPLVDGDNPFVEVRYLEGPHALLVWAINHSWQPQRVRLMPGFRPTGAHDLESGQEAQLEFELPRKQVRVLQLER